MPGCIRSWSTTRHAALWARSGNNEGTASLYTYFASTAVILLLVLRLPPNSGMLSSGQR